MNLFQKLVDNTGAIEEKMGYSFQDKSILALSFVHRSYYNEHRSEIKQHNERLEFLGDSVLGLIVSEYLYGKFPHETEGHLSHYRAHLVEASRCAYYVQKLGLSEFLLLGRGEMMNDGRGRESILADLFEAIIGAIYLDGGFSKVKEFFLRSFESELEKAVQEPLHNWKADLQDYCQKKYQKPPIYKVVREYGPDHNKRFEVVALLADQEIGRGNGSSKKEAEQEAAKHALEEWRVKDDGKN